MLVFNIIVYVCYQQCELLFRIDKTHSRIVKLVSAWCVADMKLVRLDPLRLSAADRMMFTASKG